MDSFFARNRLSAYLDHSLPKDEAEAVAEAVARDIALSADLRAMKKALTLLQEQGRVPAPTGFQARTMAAVAQQPVPGSQVAWLQRRLRRIPTELIAVVGAAVIVFIGLSGRQDAQTSTAVAPQAVSISQQAEVPTEVVIAPEETGAAQVTPEAPKAVPPATKPKPKIKSKDSLPPFDPSQPMGFRILHGGDQVLYDIATLADELGGRVVDVHGKLITPHPLDEVTSFKQLYLVTPSSSAEASHKRLHQRSGMAPYPLEGPKPPLTPGEVVFLVEAQM